MPPEGRSRTESVEEKGASAPSADGVRRSRNAAARGPRKLAVRVSAGAGAGARGFYARVLHHVADVEEAGVRADVGVRCDCTDAR
jgi:hypothetical protein